MRDFTYSKATTVADALAKAAADTEAAFIAGGTTLIDLARLEVMAPSAVVDITGLSFSAIETIDGDGLRIGALARNSDVGESDLVRERAPALSEALLSGASPQLRNLATVGGNLLQRTRCPYFRDTVWACNKRVPGSGCSAIGGYARTHAIFGVSSSCIATHPSDMAVALLALDAVVHTRGPNGDRDIPIGDFHVLPGDHPEIETVLRRGELITSVTIPKKTFSARSHYLKVRDRASYDFALASAAVALHVEDGRIQEARVALGGVGTKPWRATGAETALVGAPPTRATFAAAAIASTQGAEPQQDNAFKVELVKRTVMRALEELVESPAWGGDAGEAGRREPPRAGKRGRR